MVSWKNKYFFGGNDRFSVEHEALKLFESFNNYDGEVISCNASKIAEAIQEIREVCEAVKTVSLFQQPKKVWYRGVTFFNDSVVGKSSEVQLWIQRLKEVLAENPEVVFIISASPIDKRIRLVKNFVEDCISHFFDAPKVSSCIDYIRKECAKKKIIFEKDALDLFLARCGEDLAVVDNELNKLLVYISGRNRIEIKDVEDISVDLKEGDFFEPIEAFFVNDRRHFEENLSKYFSYYTEGRPLLASLQNRVRLMLQIRSLADKGDIKLGNISKEKLSELFEKYKEFSKSIEGTIFSQNAWYLSKISIFVEKFSLQKLVNLQLKITEILPRLGEGLVSPIKLIMNLYDYVHLKP